MQGISPNFSREDLISKHISEKPNLIPGLTSLDIKGIANYIKNGYSKKILILTGAGISVASGIPDFRSKGTGIYSNLQKYNLSYPEQVFSRSYFNKNPLPFFEVLGQCFLSKQIQPTPAHYLSVLLNKKGLLLKYYTQNIDGLDYLAGLPKDKLIECHGKVRISHCLSCKKIYNTEEIKEKIMKVIIPKCECGGIIQPDVVLYEDDLPDEFFEQLDKDFQGCDMLIVMGTSLKVEPFPGMIEDPPRNSLRVLINNEPVCTYVEELGEKNGRLVETSEDRLSQKFKFGHFFNRRDIFLDGDLQNNVLELIKELGWENELNELMKISA